MIKLTRLDGESFVLNAELIRYVERRGDTFVTLTNGERLAVTETMDDVVDRSLQYQQRKHMLPPIPQTALASPLGSTDSIPAAPSHS